MVRLVLFWYKILILVLVLAKTTLDFGIPKLLFLDFNFSFGIGIVQLTFNLKYIAT